MTITAIRQEAPVYYPALRSLEHVVFFHDAATGLKGIGSTIAEEMCDEFQNMGKTDYMERVTHDDGKVKYHSIAISMNGEYKRADVWCAELTGVLDTLWEEFEEDCLLSGMRIVWPGADYQSDMETRWPQLWALQAIAGSQGNFVIHVVNGSREMPEDWDHNLVPW